MKTAFPFFLGNILGTILHGLILLLHIIVRPHNKEFYELRDELTAEFDKLEMRARHSSKGPHFQVVHLVVDLRLWAPLPTMRLHR